MYDEFSTSLWPDHPTLQVFVALWTEGADDVADIRTQFMATGLTAGGIKG